MKFKINANAPFHEVTGIKLTKIEEGTVIIESDELPDKLKPFLLSCVVCDTSKLYPRIGIECQPYRRA